MTEITEPAPISGIHHLKVFVSDLAASLSWWEAATGARRDPALDHHSPGGQLFAYLLEIPGVAPYLELRLNPAAADAVAGLDPVTFAVDMRADLERLSARLDGMGIDHSPVLRGLAGWLLVVRTPDGLSVRFHTRESHEWDPENADFRSPWITESPPVAVRHPRS
jgi:catechol 2,3-dioxygenase-like lactoylglutathione lyase family enzyme